MRDEKSPRSLNGIEAAFAQRVSDVDGIHAIRYNNEIHLSRNW
jgi:hypothetical protein